MEHSSPGDSSTAKYLAEIKQLRDDFSQLKAQMTVEVERYKRELDLGIEIAQIGFWTCYFPDFSMDASPLVLKHFGLTPETYTAKADGLLKYIHPDDKKRVTTAINDALYKHAPYHVEYRVVHPSGELYWLEARGATHYDADGKPVQFTGTSIDITERIEWEEKLKSAVKNLQLEKEARERFVSALTHDLRTPLTAVKMNAQMLTRKPGEAEFSNLISKRIILSVDRADRMIRDLLEANRIKSGEAIPLQIDEYDLAEITQIAVGELKGIYGERFQLVAEQAALTGFWDGNAVQRIIENLASNAIKYGSPEAPVTVTLASEGRWVSISVHNEGVPIKAEDQQSIFEQFSRTQSAINGGQIGWGVGLTLVKGIVEAHHGSVRVESNEKAGTTFTVVLPKDARPETGGSLT